MVSKSNETRRSFIKASSVGMAALVLTSSQTAQTFAANEKMTVGIVGCGGRGHFILRKFYQNAENQFHVVAIQDPFQDRLEAMKDRFEIPDAKVFQGLHAYREMMETAFDAALITSPPYAHPDQVQRAVAAGKHVWLAKPVAVDVPGCQSILESSKKAQGKTNFLVDFQTRNSPNFKECVSRVHRGDIGEIALGHVYYHAGRLGPQTKPGASDDENRLRNWVFDIKLSGDIIVEQNVHVLDVANWYLNSHPIKAVGTGGRKVRTDIGDCYDHFVVTYTYPNGATVDFSSAQFTKGYDDLCIRMYGSKGTADSHYAGANWGRGPVRIDGDNPWEGTERDNTWDAVDNNVKDFVQAFRSGEFINHGDYAVSSTLTGVLGRTAAYAQAPVTWDEMIKKNEAYEVDLQL